MKNCLYLSALVLCSAASAQTIFTETLDSSKGTLASYGVGSVESVPVSGIMQGKAACLTINFTNWSQDLGWACGAGYVKGNTSESLHDYELSFDLFMAEIASKNASINIRLEGWDGYNFAGAKTESGEAKIKLPAVGELQRYRVNLGKLLAAKNFNPKSKTWMVIFNPKSWEMGGPGNYSMIIDNVSVALVPAATPAGK